jgi:hypothetical protein
MYLYQPRRLSFRLSRQAVPCDQRGTCMAADTVLRGAVYLSSVSRLGKEDTVNS